MLDIGVFMVFLWCFCAFLILLSNNIYVKICNFREIIKIKISMYFLLCV